MKPNILANRANPSLFYTSGSIILTLIPPSRYLVFKSYVIVVRLSVENVYPSWACIDLVGKTIFRLFFECTIFKYPLSLSKTNLHYAANCQKGILIASGMSISFIAATSPVYMSVRSFYTRGGLYAA